MDCFYARLKRSMNEQEIPDQVQHIIRTAIQMLKTKEVTGIELTLSFPHYMTLICHNDVVDIRLKGNQVYTTERKFIP